MQYIKIDFKTSGLPRSAWKLKQQSGRCGRNGLPAVDVTLIFPQRGILKIKLYRVESGKKIRLGAII